MELLSEGAAHHAGLASMLQCSLVTMEGVSNYFRGCTIRQRS